MLGALEILFHLSLIITLRDIIPILQDLSVLCKRELVPSSWHHTWSITGTSTSWWMHEWTEGSSSLISVTDTEPCSEHSENPYQLNILTVMVSMTVKWFLICRCSCKSPLKLSNWLSIQKLRKAVRSERYRQRRYTEKADRYKFGGNKRIW